MLPAAKTNLKGNLFKNIHYFQRVGFTSVVGMFYKVAMVWFWPLEHWPDLGLGLPKPHPWLQWGERWCGSCTRCWYLKFFVVLTLVGWLWSLGLHFQLRRDFEASWGTFQNTRNCIGLQTHSQQTCSLQTASCRKLSGVLCKIILVVFTCNFTIFLSEDLSENCIHWNINIVLKWENVFSGEFLPVKAGIITWHKW